MGKFVTAKSHIVLKSCGSLRRRLSRLSCCRWEPRDLEQPSELHSPSIPWEKGPGVTCEKSWPRGVAPSKVEEPAMTTFGILAQGQRSLSSSLRCSTSRFLALAVAKQNVNRKGPKTRQLSPFILTVHFPTHTEAARGDGLVKNAKR